MASYLVRLAVVKISIDKIKIIMSHDNFTRVTDHSSMFNFLKSDDSPAYLHPLFDATQLQGQPRFLDKRAELRFVIEDEVVRPMLLHSGMAPRD